MSSTAAGCCARCRGYGARRSTASTKDTDENYLAVWQARETVENGLRLGAVGNLISTTVLTAAPSRAWSRSRARSRTVASGRSCSRRSCSGQRMTRSVGLTASGPTSSTCACCTWRPRPPSDGWRRRFASVSTPATLRLGRRSGRGSSAGTDHPRGPHPPPGSRAVRRAAGRRSGQMTAPSTQVTSLLSQFGLTTAPRSSCRG